MASTRCMSTCNLASQSSSGFAAGLSSRPLQSLNSCPARRHSQGCIHVGIVRISQHKVWMPSRRPQRLAAFAGVNPKTSQQPHLQLATAKLPKGVDVSQFASSMYNFASTITSSGRNMPFILPLKTDKLDTGFQIQLLRILEGRPVSIGDLVATVETEPGVGEIFYVRFFEGEMPSSENPGADPKERLKRALDGLPDVPVIMTTLKPAILNAVKSSMG